MIWLTQWLCPQRHCSIALAWDEKETTAAAIEDTGEGLYRRGVVNRWCGICGGELHVEHGRSKFKTMEEAKPFLEECQKENLAAREALGKKY